MHTELEDLIERYLNGQASPAEAAELMQALRADPSLASTLEATSVIHEAAKNDAASYRLASTTYERILVEADTLRVMPSANTGIIPSATTSVALLLVGSVLSTALALIHEPTTPTEHVKRVVIDEPPALVLHTNEVGSAEHRANTPLVVPVMDADEGSIVGSIDETDTPELLPAPLRSTSVPVERTSMISGSHQEALASFAEQQQPSHHSIALRAASRPVTSYGSATNLMVEIGYDLSDQHQVGVSLHQDMFPVTEHVSATEVIQHSTITWLGAQYRFRPDVDLPFDAQPFGQLSVGGSALGVMTQPTLGVMIPFAGLQLGIGADVLMMAYQYQGNWSLAASPGLRCEIGYQFSFTNL